MEDLNEAPIYVEPGNGDGGGGIYPTGGGPVGPVLYPVGGGTTTGGGIFDPQHVPVYTDSGPGSTIPNNPRWQAALGPAPAQTSGPAPSNVGAPTSDPLTGFLAMLSAPGPLGIPVWVYLAGGAFAAYYFWPRGRK